MVFGARLLSTAALVAGLATAPAVHAAHWHGGGHYYPHGGGGAAGAAVIGGSAARLLRGAAARVLRLWLLNDQLSRGITPMKTLSNHLSSMALAGLLVLPGAALAQSSPSPGTQVTTPPPPANTTSPMAGHPVAGKNAEERVENRIKELHAQLRITAAEEPQWNQFAEMMRENARDIDQTLMQRAQQFQPMNALQNLQSYGQLADAHAQRVQ